jgi:uncharacterized membrane protein YphA (DoxX/SURF4 family)
MRMLSLFPQILFLAPFSATLLRIVAGLVFLYLAYFHWTNHKAGSEELSKLIGAASVIMYIYALIELALAVGLIAGAWTQAFALLGFVITLKVLLFRRSLKELRPLSSLSYALLAAICLSLVVTGAGIFAFDLPL